MVIRTGQHGQPLDESGSDKDKGRPEEWHFASTGERIPTRADLERQDFARLSEINSLLEALGANLEKARLPDPDRDGVTTVSLKFPTRASLDRFIEALQSVVLSPEEEKEAAEIMSRIDRELPDMEARLDVLMRHYGLSS